MEEGHVGLGFHAQDVGGDASETLLKQYMAHCLDYHQAQTTSTTHHKHPTPQQQQQQQQQHESVPYQWHQPQQHDQPQYHAYQSTTLAQAAAPPMNVPVHHQAAVVVPPPMFVSGQTLPASYVSAPPSSAAPAAAAQHVQVLVPAREVPVGGDTDMHDATGAVSSIQQQQMQADSILVQQQHEHQTLEHDRAIDDALALAMRVPPSTNGGSGPSSSSAVPAPPRKRSVPSSISIPTKSPTEYSAARARHAEIESKRLRAALLKNFEYVARRDEEDMKRHMDELERQRMLGKEMEKRHRKSLEGRMAMAASSSTNKSGGGVTATSKSGIGTKSRQKIERTKRKEGHVVIDTSRQRELRCAVYITGLPVEDGAISEDGLAALFGSYGTIKRVTLYVDKRTGKRKGDGLVVYDVPKLTGSSGVWKVAEDIVRAVCEQMNGAELQCGSRISVEPADADYSNKKSKASDTGAAGPNAKGTSDIRYYGPSSAVAASASAVKASEADNKGVREMTEEANVDKEGGGADDLDDFFASL